MDKMYKQSHFYTKPPQLETPQLKPINDLKNDFQTSV